MKGKGKVLPSRGTKIQSLKAKDKQGQPLVPSKQGSKKDLLLRHPNFVAKPTNPSFEPPPLACEASALTTELIAPNPGKNSPKLRRLFLASSTLEPLPLNQIIFLSHAAGQVLPLSTL